ncbi:MAG: sigma-70 family RNA polymerase sigma factor [Bacteroidota bacterium]
MKDDTIIAAMKAGGREQEKALSYIYHNEDYRKGVRYVVNNFRQLRSEDWEGIFHEGIVHLTKCLVMEKFRQETSLKNYFLGICRNKCREMVRKDKKTPPTLDLPPEDPDQVKSPLEIMLGEELKDMLRAAVKMMSKRCQEILQLKAMSYSMKEIAEELELSGERVAITYNSRCKQQLKNKLQENPNLLNILREYRWI